MIKRFNHVGIAVKDLDRTVAFFEKTFGAKLLWRKKFDDQKIESAFVSIGLLDAFVDLIPRLRMVDVAASFHMARISGAYLRILNADDDINLDSEKRFSCIVAANEKLGMSIFDVVQ